MIEMRIVEIGDGCRSEIQYRYMLLIADGYSGAVYKKGEIWSEWQTAPYVNLRETEND
jgi:hypothetical protein